MNTAVPVHVYHGNIKYAGKVRTRGIRSAYVQQYVDFTDDSRWPMAARFSLVSSFHLVCRQLR